jgi:hypothetical protein
MMYGGPQGSFVISSNSDRAKTYRAKAMSALQHNNMTPEQMIHKIERTGRGGRNVSTLRDKDNIPLLFFSDGHSTSLVAWHPDYKMGEWILVYKRSSLSTLAYYDLIKTYPVQETEEKPSVDPVQETEEKPSVDPVQETLQESNVVP